MSALPLQFTLEREGSYTTLAVNQHKLGVFGDPRSAIFDGARWKELPELEPSRLPRHLELFFGRDDQPRVMGYLGPSDAEPALEPFYRRFKAGRWQREPGELGALASGGGALYGVLGPLDPEVVCRPKGICLVKRVSGWTRIPAHDAPARIVLAGDTAWALWPGHVQRLEATGFADWGPPRAWRDPRGIWVEIGGRPWVLEPSERALFRLEAGTWVRYDTPFAESSAFWAEPSGQVWLVGSGGAAYLSRNGWRCVPGVRGPLSAITPLGDELWLAGAAGVFRGRPRATPGKSLPSAELTHLEFGGGTVAISWVLRARSRLGGCYERGMARPVGHAQARFEIEAEPGGAITQIKIVSSDLPEPIQRCARARLLELPFKPEQSDATRVTFDVKFNVQRAPNGHESMPNNGDLQSDEQ